MMKNAYLPLTLLTLSLFACSSSSVEDVDTDESEDALVTTTIGAISASSRQGFLGLPNGGCQPSVGTWRIEFTSKKLTGSLCSNGAIKSVDKTLSLKEVQDVRAALRKVRPAAAPGACPMDAPSQSLDVERVAKPNVKFALEKYIDLRSSCNSSDRKPATNLDSLVGVLRSLSAAGPSPIFDANVTKVNIDRAAGLYTNAGPLDQCALAAANYSIEIATGNVERNVCVRRTNSFPAYNSMDKESGKLSAKDLVSVKNKLGALQEQISNETHCAPGRAVSSVSFVRPGSTTRFVDEYSSCASTDRKVGNTEFEALIDFVASAKLQ